MCQKFRERSFTSSSTVTIAGKSIFNREKYFGYVLCIEVTIYEK